MRAQSALGALQQKALPLLLSLSLTAGFSAGPVLAAQAAEQTETTRIQLAQFPFNDQQPLTPEQVKIQKYKMERIRVQVLRDEWFIVRGINERLDDMTLLKLVGRTTKVDDHEFKQLVGNGMALGGLALVAGGGLMLTDVLKFQNSFWVGIGLIIIGGATAIGGELYAGNIGEEAAGHIIDRPEAEAMAKEYNDKLKRDLGIEHVPNLDS